MKKELQSNVNGMTSGGGSIQHPFSIHSASIGTRWKLHGLQSLMMTILLLFTMGIGQMWGAISEQDVPSSTFTCGTTAGYDTYFYTFSSDASNSDTIVFSAYDSYNSSITWASYTGGRAGSSASWKNKLYAAASGTSEVDRNGTPTGLSHKVYNSGNYYTVRSTRTLRYLVTNCTGVSISGYTSSSKTLYLKAYVVTAGTPAASAAQTAELNSSSQTTVGISSLSASNTYLIELSGEVDNNNHFICEVAFIYPHASSGPSVSTFSPATGAKLKTGATVTVTGSTGSTVYCMWASSAPANAAAVVSGGTAGTAGAATVTSSGIASATTLYAVAVKGDDKSVVASASYTIDDTAPTFSSSTPANSATGVAASGTIVLTFSEALANVDGSKFTLTGATKGTVAIDGTDATKVNVAYSGAASEATVKLSVKAAAVADAAGNALAADLSDISFTTAAAAPCPTSGTVFSMAMKQVTDANKKALTADEQVNLGTADYATVAGGIATFTNLNAAKGKIEKGNPGYLNFNGNAAYLILDLDCQLNTGDSIIVAITTENEMAFTTSATLDATYQTETTDGKGVFVVPAALNNVDKIYCWRASSSTSLYFTAITIKRPAKYAMTFAAGEGGSGSMDAIQCIEKSQVTLPACTFTAPDGKDFDAWVVTETVGGASVPVSEGKITMPQKAVTATATWKAAATKYAVTYSLNGAPGDAPTSPDKAEGDEVTLASDPSWAGHAFDGWEVKEATSGDEVSVSAGKFTMPDDAVNITAQWHELDCKIYSLTGGIGSATVEAGAATVSASSLVLANTDDIIKLIPASGETFKAGDVITISGTVGNTTRDFGVKISATANKGDGLGTASVAGSTNPMIATATLSANADFLYICRKGGTTQTILTCEVHRSCAEGTAAGLSYATAEVEKLTTDAAFTNPLTNTNSLVLAGYKSSNEEVATVNFSTGAVTIVGAGSATISVASAVQTKASTLYAAGTASYTLTVSTPPTFAVTYDNNGGDGTMTDSNSPYVEGAEVTLLTNSFTAPDTKEFDAWVVTKTASGDPVSVTAGKFTMPGEAVTVTATWKAISTKYAITKGAHTNGDFTIDPAEQEEGKKVTLVATPAENYLFDAWAIVKTEDASATGITVDANGQFVMPAYGVTVNATFAADPRQKVLYVTSNSEADTKSDDKVYAALKDIYNVKIVGPTSDADQSTFALVVLHESVGGGSHNATAVAAAKVGTTPVLNTKAYFYNNANTTNQRWNWGTPSAGKKTKGVHVNRAYCNITDHPLFTDLTPDANDSIIILSSINSDNKPIQPITAFTTGKEGYTLAIVPDGCAIHELTPAQRGASSGKYLLISLYSKDFANLNANGQKLFQNAAAYLIGSTSWTPISVPTSPEVTATPSAAYSAGDDIALTASATGAVATTTYTWYKGATWAAAEEAGAIKAAATAAAGGNTFGVTGCAAGDAGIYWCVISNGTGCDAKASLEVTVSTVSYNITFSNGGHGTAPSATTGVSYTLPELSASGWAHQGWTASIDVTVDEATVTTGDLIANGKIAIFGADVEFTAVWKQEFQVSFNLKGHGDPIAAQIVVDGDLATEPDAPFEIGQIFGGWFTDENCTEGNEFNFSTPITDNTPLYAKWTEFTGCTELWPATSGSAPAAVGDAIVMQTGSHGATITAEAKPERLTYTAYGLQFGNESGVKVNVVLNNDMTVGTKISLTLVATAIGERGLHLYNADGSAKITSLGWADATVHAEETFTYTVVADDGLDGTNAFQLWRNNTVILKTLKVESCGASVTYHDLTSAVNIAGKGTVTLGASSVREGYTTTATYSDIDAAYEFDEWQISGTGASIADASANPAVITMGTGDAVVTLKLKTATPKHTVTFNKMGKGDDIASQLVAEGAKVTEPTVTEPEGWLLEGWYKESTFENKWDFASNVMSTSDIELFANWVADTSIKLFSNTGVLNTTNFVSAAASTIEIDAVEHVCLAQFASNRSSLAGTVPADMVQYNATTNAAKIQITFYNTNSSAKRAYLYRVKEGDTEATPLEISVPGQEIWTTEYYTFNGEENRSFYVTAGDRSNIRILQVRVVDNGTAIKQAGQAGYSLNFNKGRLYVKNGVETSFEGMTINASSEYKVFNNSNIATNSNFSFTTTVDKMVLKVTRSGGNYYVSQDPASKGTIYNNNQEIVLTPAGTWYIGSETSGSAASFSKIEFIAPKCEAPAFNALANSDICSGDPYVALDGTGTVTDGGTITYKWYAQGSETVLATTATYTPTADGSYYVKALHHVDGYTDNEATSDVVTVTTHAGTVITEPLVDLRGAVDAVLALTVEATGKNLHYTWKECATISGEYADVAGAADSKTLNVTVTASMDKYYKVIVHSDCGADQESVAHVTQFVPVSQQDVTASIVWDWTEAASDNTAEMKNNTTPARDAEFIMANGDARIYNNANFWSDKLVIAGQFAVRGGNYFQGGLVKFHTTVAGVVRVTFSHTGTATEEKPARELFVNGVATGATTANTTRVTTAFIDVPAGDVSITAQYIDPTKPGNQYVRVYKVEFYTITERRTEGWIVPGELGTACLKDASLIDGAKVYELQGANGNGYMVFDEILNGEMEAGKPYLFEATANGQVSFYTLPNAAHTEDAGSTKGMYGTFENVTFHPETDVNIYYFSGTHIWAVKDFTVDITIPAYRCYVDYEEFKTHPVLTSNPAPGRRRVVLGVNGKNTATGVENAEAIDAPVKMMIDGQLFILRGEKMYDATGRLVK